MYPAHHSKQYAHLRSKLSPLQTFSLSHRFLFIIYNITMTKCLHNQDIQLFCVKSNCHYATPGGCFKCFQADHMHQKQQLMELDEVLKLMTRYSFPNRVKPECAILQQTFYTFFKKTQTQFKQLLGTLDQICKNVVNTIGFPFLSFKHYFKVYKRIKNREYNRIGSAQFYQFVTETKNIPLLKLAQLQQKLYLKQVGNYHQMVKQINGVLETFQRLTKSYDLQTKFIHDNSAFLHNKQIVQKIKLNLRQNIKTDNEARLLRDSLNSNVNQNSKSRQKNMINNRNRLRYSLGQKVQGEAIKQHGQEKRIQRRHTIYTQNQEKQRKIQISLDKKIVANKSKLQQKVSELKKSNFQFKNQADNEYIQSEEGRKQTFIRNNNLPPAEENTKMQKYQEQLQVFPITRKLEEKIYPFQQQEAQISSPLLKKKMRSDSKKSESVQNSDLGRSPNGSPHGSPNINKSAELNNRRGKINEFELKLEDVKKMNPQLTQQQQKSFVTLINSLKLQAEKAIPIVQKALSQCSRNLSAAEYLSFLYLETNEYEKCLKICNKYISMVEKNKSLVDSKILLVNNKACSLNNLGRYSEAVKLLINTKSMDGLILKNLGNAYYGLGYLDQAIQAYKKVTEQSFDDQMYYNLCGCYYLKKQAQQAKKLIYKLLESQPNNKDYLQLQKYIGLM